MINTRFNRIESGGHNIYLPFYGAKFDISNSLQGIVKCKLLHSDIDSLVLPDQIYIKTDKNNFIWFQPLTFLANLLVKDDDLVTCVFFVDIPCGRTLKVTFTNKDLLYNLPDNSSLYTCKIDGPPDLSIYSTGSGKFIDKIPFLELFHHTTNQNKRLISNGKNIYGSRWNIQGTKDLENVSYFYLSCLNKIKAKEDLKQIAMASDGKIHLLKDNSNVPEVIKPEDIPVYKDDIVELNVYRENTYNRRHTLKFLVDSCILSPKHLWMHFPKDGFAFYEFCMPYIYRIGIKIGESIPFDLNMISTNVNIIAPLYQVIGNATEKDGLIAIKKKNPIIYRLI
ncbi:MAG: hypothetical protein LBU84_17640 [Prevotella sp.]|jgi:hypothetical protein|nr:hypothetical protein [Prevotella sp.]